MAKNNLKIGERVEGGKRGTEDHDTGRVIAVDGDEVTVAWDSLATTTQTRDCVRRIARGGRS